jgi:hypothetical protein
MNIMFKDGIIEDCGTNRWMKSLDFLGINEYSFGSIDTQSVKSIEQLKGFKFADDKTEHKFNLLSDIIFAVNNSNESLIAQGFRTKEDNTYDDIEGEIDTILEAFEFGESVDEYGDNILDKLGNTIASLGHIYSILSQGFSNRIDELNKLLKLR